jgi:hypothetical protein
MEHTIEIPRGDSYRLEIKLSRNGVFLPFVEGDKLYFTVKKSVNTTEKLIQKVITTFENGIAYIDILPTDTQNLSFETYKYDIQFNQVGGAVKTIITPSDLIIGPTVTDE